MIKYSSITYYNEVRGYNSRLDELQAAFLRIKLQNLVNENDQRKIFADKYHELLGSIDKLILPVIAESRTTVNHIYLLRTDRRDELQQYLGSYNIETMIHYPVPPYLQLAYKELGYKKGGFPIAENITSTCLSLSMCPPSYTR